MVPEMEPGALARRRVMWRDSLGFLTLVAVTALLFGMTLLLFRSFTSHRDELARRWADRGAQNLRAGRPDEAIGALRTALTYAPDNRAYEQTLAQALGEAGRTDESYAYFMTLWEGQPGSGFINLQLARLQAKRGDRTAAVEFYRASIYGTWEGDGVVRRSAVRLELARYLIGGGQFDPARMELLIAAGNSPETAQLDVLIASLLDEAQDSRDAWTYYEKGAALAPRDASVLEAAGLFAYRSGDFASAHRLLDRSQGVRTAEHERADPKVGVLRDHAGRIVEIVPMPTLPGEENARRVAAARRTAKRRLDACAAQMPGGPAEGSLQTLLLRWSGPEGTATGASLRDATMQQLAMRLVFDTERVTNGLCAQAEGDDALLLLVAERSMGPEPGVDPSTWQAGRANR